MLAMPKGVKGKSKDEMAVADLPPPPSDDAEKKGSRSKAGSPTKGRKSQMKGRKSPTPEPRGEEKNTKVAPAGKAKEEVKVEEEEKKPLTDMEEIMLPEGSSASNSEVDQMLQQIANEAVNGVVTSVIGLIKKGELQQHAPAKAWGAQGPDKEKRDRVLAQKRYNRIQRLLVQAENGQVDAQKELMKINQQLDRDHLSGASPEDIILEDLSALIKAKEDRRKELEFKKKLQEARKMEKKKEERRAKKRQRELDEFGSRMRDLERIMQERMDKDKESKKKRLETKAAERKKEEEMRAQFVNATKKRLGTVPLHKRMQRNYEKKVVIPELEKRKQYLAQVRNDMRQPHYVEIAQHEAKIRDWEADERTRLAELTIPKNHIPEHYKSTKQQQDVRRRDAEQADKIRGERERKLKSKRNQLDYASKVREKYKPNVDAAKAAEVEKACQNVDKDRARAMRARGDEMMKNANDNLKSGYKEVLGDMSPADARRRRKKTPEPIPQEKPKDYLQDLKAERSTKGKKRRSSSNVPLSPEQLHEKARRQEKDAEAREANMMGESSGGGFDVDEAAAVSEMYLDVVQTKMKLLSQPAEAY